ncbi:hypothetical protein GQ600_25170 [Phytophthora cactorum]|nr:hypothetical protein GQ600_25170 [Phytophthora cactorum]
MGALKISGMSASDKLKVEAALKPTPNRKEPCQMGAHRKVKAKYNAVSFPVPPALPIQKGKKLCMKYLSTEGCTGEGGTCIYDTGTFLPNKLPGIVNACISKAYGGIRATQWRREAVQSIREGAMKQTEGSSLQTHCQASTANRTRRLFAPIWSQTMVGTAAARRLPVGSLIWRGHKPRPGR